MDNEVITVDFANLDPAVEHVALVLNSYKGQDFGTIPFASIRIYEGTPTSVREVFAKYDIANDKSFSGHVAMVMGVFYKRNNEWKIQRNRRSYSRQKTGANHSDSSAKIFVR